MSEAPAYDHATPGLCGCPDPARPGRRRSAVDPAQGGDRVRRQGPARHRRRAGQGTDEPGREAVQDGPVTETVALLDAGTGADHGLGPDHAAVTHDRAGFDDAAAADVTAVDHRARTDHRVTVDDQLVVRQQVQHRVLQDLYPGADADRAV